MTLRGQNLIAGQWTTETGTPFFAHNPLTGANLEPKFFEATAAHVNRAASAAEDAFRDMRHARVEQIIGLLLGIAEGIVALGNDLIQRAIDETGLPAARLESERQRTVYQLRMFAEMVREGSWVDARIDRGDAQRQPLPKPDIRRMLIPIGPVAMFSASNFPLAFSVAGTDTASALAARCPVIVKAHPAHPGVSELTANVIVKALSDNGLPAGAFSMVHGVSHGVGAALVRHPSVAAVAFTGSLAGGRSLYDIAAARPAPIPVYAEMGSINPLFILSGILEKNAEEIAVGLIRSVTLGAGQFCTKPGMVVGIKGNAFDRLIQRCKAEIATTGPHHLLYPHLKAQYTNGATRMRSIPGLQALVHHNGDSDPSTVVPASLWRADAAVVLKSPGARQELFGPSTLFVECATMNEMLEVAGTLEGELTGNIHGTPLDLQAAGDLIDLLETRCGRVVFNGYPTGVEVCSAMQHGGPYPASTDARTTSVGSAAILRFVRPIAYQNAADELLPMELQNANPRNIVRFVDGNRTSKPLT